MRGNGRLGVSRAIRAPAARMSVLGWGSAFRVPLSDSCICLCPFWVVHKHYVEKGFPRSSKSRDVQVWQVKRESFLQDLLEAFLFPNMHCVSPRWRCSRRGFSSQPEHTKPVELSLGGTI